jgi:hypothetical protein
MSQSTRFETTTERINKAIVEYKVLAKKYISIGGVTPQETIEELEQIKLDILNPEYDEIFSDYSDCYKEENCMRPRPFIPPSIKEMNSFFDGIRKRQEQEEEEKREKASREADRKKQVAIELKRMRAAGSIGALFPEL